MSKLFQILWLCLVPLGLFACSSAPTGGVEEPSEVREVEVLDAHFVRVQGERIPLDEFLFRTRQIGQRWVAEKVPGRKRFGVKLIGNVSALTPATLERVIDDIRLSGVQSFDL